MIKRFRNYVESSPWDEQFIRIGEHGLNPILWWVIGFSAGYFLGVCGEILQRMP